MLRQKESMKWVVEIPNFLDGKCWGKLLGPVARVFYCAAQDRKSSRKRSSTISGRRIDAIDHY